jgi:hypothetical protein
VSNGSFFEFPISTYACAGRRIPFSGGGYFRLLPRVCIHFMSRALIRCGHPVMVYLHPWEFDPDQPRVNAGLLNRFRHYVNIGKTSGKLRAFIAEFGGMPLRDYWQSVLSGMHPDKT